MKIKTSSSPFSRPATIVLTGGPGVGKTSIIENLKKLKYDVREEVFTFIFAKAQKEDRFNDQFLHSPEIINELICAQKELEAIPCQSDVLFLDRSRIDILGFSKNMGITPFDQDRKELIEGLYDLFFVIAPLPQKYYLQNNIRRQTYEESLEHHEMVMQRYDDYLKANKNKGKSFLIEVPFHGTNMADSVSWRTKFILSQIEEHL